MPKLVRSFNPLLKGLKFFPSKKSGLKSFINPESCQAIIDKLDLSAKYPNASKSLEVVDIFSGFGMLSTMINQELKPKTHVIMEDSKACIPHYEDIKLLLENDSKRPGNLIHYPQSGYTWENFDDLIKKDKLINPSFQSEDKVHDELLIVANLLSAHYGESLFAQWILCLAHKNWLQKYGRVRMICAVPEQTAQKFLSGPGFIKRNRSCIKRDIFTETKLIAINEIEGDNYMPDGYHYDPNLLVQNQPVVLPLTSIVPMPTRMAIVEVVPKPKTDIDIESLEFVTQILMYRATRPLGEALKYISPGAQEDLSPKLEHLLHKTPRELTAEDYHELITVFDAWPFKPGLEERLSLNPVPDEDL